MLFSSLSEPLPESKGLMEGSAEKSCSHRKGMRQAHLGGKILKDRNINTQIGTASRVKNGGTPFMARKHQG